MSDLGDFGTYTKHWSSRTFRGQRAIGMSTCRNALGNGQTPYWGIKRRKGDRTFVRVSAPMFCYEEIQKFELLATRGAVEGVGPERQPSGYI